MNHISIEGMDGVGKTTTCRLLAERLGYRFIEKPLHYLYEDGNSFIIYQEVAKKVNSNPDRIFTSWYYGLNNIYLYDIYKGEDIVTDRHIVSNYAWSGTKDNKDIYDLIIKKIGLPKLTVILYGTYESIVERLRGRNKEDKDIKRARKSEEIYSRMISFCRDRNIPYVIIKTDKKKPDEVVNEILKKLGELDD